MEYLANDKVDRLADLIYTAALSLKDPTEFSRVVVNTLDNMAEVGLQFSGLSFYMIQSGSLEATQYYLDRPASGWNLLHLEESAAEVEVYRTSLPKRWEWEGWAFLSLPGIHGVLTVSRKCESSFSRVEQAVYEQIIRPLEILVVRHHNLFTLAKIRSRSIDTDAGLLALYDGSYAMFGNEPIKVGAQIIRTAVDKLGFDRCGIFLVDKDGKYLRGAWGLDENGEIVAIAATVFEIYPEESERLSEAARIVRGEFEYYLTQDLDGEGGDSQEGDIRANLSVPMRVGDRILGVLSVDNYLTNRPIEEGHIRPLMVLANHGAAALENARFQQELETNGQQLQHLSHRLVQIQEQERTHLARELHDEIGQVLTGLSFILMPRESATANELKERMDKARKLIKELVGQVRDLSLELRPATLDALGLETTLNGLVKRYTNQTGIQVAVDFEGIDRRFDPECEIAVYRIVQEALTNVARHAQVEKVVVKLRVKQQKLEVLVCDQGIGFNPEAALISDQGTGLIGMRERTGLLRGRFSIESKKGIGTQVRAVFSVQNDSASLCPNA